MKRKVCRWLLSCMDQVEVVTGMIGLVLIGLGLYFAVGAGKYFVGIVSIIGGVKLIDSVPGWKARLSQPKRESWP